ncbi:MAG: hypothetical protein J6V44_15265 [Methanobrevibacter sp.]|nr:hypothetical protein [Methanobrevibacter sp.]MBO7696590.1 hypothetical protein [Methanobrevibacter sp.]
MNKFIAKIFKSANVNAKVSKDSENPRFKVVDNNLTLEGIVKNNKYSMKIKDPSGKVIDNLSVIITNSNDIVNRINESVNTLKMLSSVYDNKKLQEEAEEFDDVVVDEEEVEEEPANIVDGLEQLYDAIVDVAKQAEDLTDVANQDDAEEVSTLISFASSLYDTAIDVDDFIDDLVPEEEEDDDVQESFKRQRKSIGTIRKVISNLTMAENLVRRQKDMKDIHTAIKDIKAELIARGY